ncbi:RHS repeat-associated core domain-containing protein [Luteibacter aegosomatis]|uniref:RHS repeat-associated core domain-containing protein n=1 Tax=Luteibacter aegosomatis TaxID=2911537 RepID=UPI001FF94120|nr:RHS repeat-associated core domain-containing protein [Luteibacter aegosomatis]UPG85994.1 RHS repeat-associated core domain-containing protein [Luteibacter aegosomatis]
MNRSSRPITWRGILTSLLIFSASTVANGQSATARVTYYYTDPQGTVLATADEQGNILSRSDYQPYGDQVLGTPADGPGYTGHVDDSDANLVYMQARYYDPTIGRFLSVDPAQSEPGKVSEFNRYAYAINNPVNNVDTDGRQSVPLGSYSQYWPGSEAEKQRNYINGMAGTLISIATMSNVFDVAPAGSGSGAVASTGFPFEFTGAAALVKGAGAAIGLGTSLAGNLSHDVAAGNFFRNTTYTPRVLAQMSRGPGEFHAFPESVTAFAKEGTLTKFTGGDGNPYQKLEIPGSYSSRSNAYDGVFQFIKNDQDEITHRLFVPDNP